VSQDPHVLLPGALDGAVAGTVVPLTVASERHLRKVLRRGDGSGLQVTDGLGASAGAELANGGARLLSDPVVAPRPSPRLVLVQALSKGRRAEDAVRMACEMGVDRIVPVVAERTQGRPDVDAAMAVVERWEAIAAAALEQSRGVRLAEVGHPVAIDGLNASGAAEDVLRMVSVPDSPPLPDVLVAAHRDPVEVHVAIGPEGGWTAAEVGRLVAGGWVRAGLGPSILRTEHAGPVALAVIAAMCGRWRTGQVTGLDPDGG